MKRNNVVTSEVVDMSKTQDTSTPPNLKEIVSNILFETIGAYAQQHFLNEPSIAVLKNTDSEMTIQEFILQRTVINDYFVHLLMRFRTRTSKEVLGVLPYLSLEGRVDDWLNLFSRYIIVFFKDNDVYDAIRD